VINKQSIAPSLVPVSPPLIHWKIITPEVTDGWNAAVKEQKQEPYIYVGLSHKDYLAFTGWLNEVLVYVKSQKEISKMGTK
jgi:hypothetical protein